MAEPILTFGFAHTTAGDTAWGYLGENEEDPNKNGWKVITPTTDLVVFTGGGIDDADTVNSGANALGNITIASGTRSATIRPSVTSYVIPYTYVEQDLMYWAKNAGYNVNRYAMGVHIKGYMTSDLYLEAWDDNSFSTTDLEILEGTGNSGYNSFINAIRTTQEEPPWHPGWTGADNNAAYLRGQEDRVRLNNTSTITDSTVYYNIYIRLETDCSTFHVFPVLGFRYLYT
jgi:hypothetical protein